jgi:hypothetical protein
VGKMSLMTEAYYASEMRTWRTRSSLLLVLVLLLPLLICPSYEQSAMRLSSQGRTKRQLVGLQKPASLPCLVE